MHHLYTGAGSCLASFRTAGAYRHPALLGSANSCSRSSSRSPPDTLRHHGQFSANGQCFSKNQRSLHHLQSSQPTNRHHPPTLPSPTPPSTRLSSPLTTTSLPLLAASVDEILRTPERNILTPPLKQQSHRHAMMVQFFLMPHLDPRMPGIGAFLHTTSSASQ